MFIDNYINWLILKLRKSSVNSNDLASNVIGSGGSQSEIKSLTPLGRLGQDGDFERDRGVSFRPRDDCLGHARSKKSWSNGIHPYPMLHVVYGELPSECDREQSESAANLTYHFPLCRTSAISFTLSKTENARIQ